MIELQVPLVPRSLQPRCEAPSFATVPDVVGVVLGFVCPSEHLALRRVNRSFNAAVEDIAEQLPPIHTQWESVKWSVRCYNSSVDVKSWRNGRRLDGLFVWFKEVVDGLTLITGVFTLAFAPIWVVSIVLHSIALLIGFIFLGVTYKHATACQSLLAVTVLNSVLIAVAVLSRTERELLDVARSNNGVMVAECQSDSPHAIRYSWQPSQITFEHAEWWQTSGIVGSSVKSRFYYFTLLGTERTIGELGVNCSGVINNYNSVLQTWDEFLRSKPKAIAVAALDFPWAVLPDPPLTLAGARGDNIYTNNLDQRGYRAWKSSDSWIVNRTALAALSVTNFREINDLVENYRVRLIVAYCFTGLSFVLLLHTWIRLLLHWKSIQSQYLLEPDKDLKWSQRLFKRRLDTIVCYSLYAAKMKEVRERCAVLQISHLAPVAEESEPYERQISL